MRKTLFLLSVLLTTAVAAFAFDAYKDSTVLTGADMAAVKSKINGYQNYTITDSRGFEYTGFVLIEDNTLGQYMQLSNYTNTSKSHLQLPDVGFPIEEVSMDVSYTTGSGEVQNRNIYLMPAPSTNHADTVNAIAKCNIGTTGTTHIDLVVTSPEKTTAALQLCKNGIAIWKITIKWTVTGELPCKSIDIVPDKLTLCEGGSDSLRIKTDPVNATEPITWKSLDETVATVTDGKVTALHAGEAKIVATATGGATDTCLVSVRAKATSITITVDSEEIDTLYMYADIAGSIYDVTEFGAAFLPDNAFVENIAWQSTNTAAVTIDANSGYAQAQAPGKAYIVATSTSGLKDSCLVIVKGKLMPEQVIINVHELNFGKGEYTTLTAEVLPAELDEDLREVNWSSLNENVATVSARGYVQAVGAGTTYIVATTYNGIADSCKITVGGKPTEGEYYVKVNAAPKNWSGRYLIVCEQENLALNGGLNEFDVAENTIAVTITDEAIEANSTTNAASFTIQAHESGYSLQGASGKYIGYDATQTQYQNKNGLQTSSTPLVNTIALDGFDAKIIGADGSQLMYNGDESASGRKLLFRYYANPASVATLVKIQLYRYLLAPTAIEQVEIESLYVENGRIACDYDFRIYDLLGRDVTRQNGQLKGIYIVKTDNMAQKVVVR